jgi:hypothetical protein
MNTSISGRCRCGDIVYEFTSQPTRQYLCYCRDCQYFTGTDKIFVVSGPRSTFNLCQGTPQSYEVIANSGARINREPRRDSRRLQSLRGWSREEINEVFSGSP